MKSLLIVLMAFVSLIGQAKEGDELIGTKPPEWILTNWFNSAPLSLSDLKGQVVLIRWWTAPDCPYCKASAPALNEFHESYRNQGLRVVGVYHHKGSDPMKLDSIKNTASQYGFRFPIAVDPEWHTLRSWWLKHEDRRWTSVTFLLDRTGVIRFIHPGGEYVRGDNDYRELKKNIEELLAE